MFNVTIKDDSVILTNKQVEIGGFFDKESAILYMPILNNLPPQRFTKKNDSTALGFYPSVPYLKINTHTKNQSQKMTAGTHPHYRKKV